MSELETKSVPLSKLHESPTNPRKLFGSLTELAASLESQGVLQPLLVRTAANGFEVIDGHRRLRAAKLAGLKELPIVVRELGDVEVIEAQLTSTLQREDVHPLELAEGYQQLVERGFKGEQVAARLGVSRASVFAYLRLLKLSEVVRKELLAGRISLGQAHLVGRIQNERMQELALVDIEKLGGVSASFRQVEKVLLAKYGEARHSKSRAAKRKAAPDGAAQLVGPLLDAVAEAVSRKAFLDDSDLRLVVLALTSTSDAALDALAAAGVTQERLGTLRGARLRGLAVRVALSQWVATPQGQSLAAKAYRVDLDGLRDRVAADGLLRKPAD